VQLGGHIDAMVSYEKSPAAAHMPPEWRSKIIHARAVLGSTVLMDTDDMSERYREPKGFSISLIVDSTAEAVRAFHVLSQDGTVGIALEANFFAARYGALVDQFGIPWMVVYQTPS
jgi:PhnB protein